MPASRSPGPPEGFTRAVASLRAGRLPAEVQLAEVAAPQRLAPFSVALSAEVSTGSESLATGRLVLLYDPAGQEAWEGRMRLVAFAQAAVDPAIGADPLLPAVGWSWLTDALGGSGAAYTAAGGTVTRVNSERFGTLAGQPELAEIELRASWSPVGEELASHLAAFGALLCSAAGLAPSVPGVLPIPAGPGQRRVSSRRPGTTTRR